MTRCIHDNTEQDGCTDCEADAQFVREHALMRAAFRVDRLRQHKPIRQRDGARGTKGGK